MIELGRNYRSTPEIVGAAEAVLRDGDGRRGTRAGVRPPGPAPTITAYATDEDEARGVATGLRDAHGVDVAWSDLAVLYRTNAQSAAFEAALGAAGIPYRVRGGAAFLRRPEVRAALDDLRAAARAVPSRGFAEHLVDLAALGEERSAPTERAEHVEALVRLGREYLDAEAGPGSLDGFEAFLAAALRDDTLGDASDAVELLTFHRAKGLEFRTVFVTGLERGLVPISYADTPATARRGASPPVRGVQPRRARPCTAPGRGRAPWGCGRCGARRARGWPRSRPPRTRATGPRRPTRGPA